MDDIQELKVAKPSENRLRNNPEVIPDYVSVCVAKIKVQKYRNTLPFIRTNKRVHRTNADAQHVCFAFASVAVAPSVC